jgi:nitroimidazol reductase NimA-like FMN-containing flavoprotein (pyridoxamine 5'-phosphate oxidase superfamily)
MSPASKRPRSRISRVPDRADYDLETVGAILDAAPVCHVGLVGDGGFPVVIPMLHARAGDRLYLHGSSAGRLIRGSGESEICVTATIVDGLVLARSAFHHSVNYRSAVVFGRPERIEDEAGKLTALEAFTEKIIPGRWADARPPTSQELKGTGVLRMTIDEASAKVRTGGAVDEPEDYGLPIWAGTVPLRTVAGEAEPDERLLEGVEEPGYVAEYRDTHS